MKSNRMNTKIMDRKLNNNTIFYKKSSNFLKKINKFVQWYRMEKVFGPVFVYKYSTLIVFFIFLFILNLSVGIGILYLSSQYIECKIPYEYKTQPYTTYSIIKVTPEHCKGRENLTELKGEINVHYEIYGVQQNHYNFMKSFNTKQLGGKIFVSQDYLNQCYPLITYFKDRINKILHPCGILPWHVFTDNYIFYDKEPDDAPFPDPLPLKERVEDITIKYFRKFFKNPHSETIKLYKDQVYFWMDTKAQSEALHENIVANDKLLILPQALKYNIAGNAMENSHFINWMIPSPFRHIKRLYGKLDGPISFPFYIYIENNFRTAEAKAIIITEANFYINNNLIGIIFIILSIFSLILSILYYIRMKKHKFMRRIED
ncbi:LEM3/CDC50 family protein, putative [Plasmodium vinckei brucechwatti]|uniref:LEM3/CDC50 family protein, putative n=1 Tax=Plasmodium vinckei brucechwatti TaxID=119398 RepID=A0A6V7S6G2_PLAVN|nr:LEM3/CDC50 family protein, putative [Plasmodium vinckei brucechwatti]